MGAVMTDENLLAQIFLKTEDLATAGALAQSFKSARDAFRICSPDVLVALGDRGLVAAVGALRGDEYDAQDPFDDFYFDEHLFRDSVLHKLLRHLVSTSSTCTLAGFAAAYMHLASENDVNTVDSRELARQWARDLETAAGNAAVLDGVARILVSLYRCQSQNGRTISYTSHTEHAIAYIMMKLEPIPLSSGFEFDADLLLRVVLVFMTQEQALLSVRKLVKLLALREDRPALRRAMLLAGRAVGTSQHSIHVRNAVIEAISNSVNEPWCFGTAATIRAIIGGWFVWSDMGTTRADIVQLFESAARMPALQVWLANEIIPPMELDMMRVLPLAYIQQRLYREHEVLPALLDGLCADGVLERMCALNEMGTLQARGDDSWLLHNLPRQEDNELDDGLDDDGLNDARTMYEHSYKSADPEMFAEPTGAGASHRAPELFLCLLGSCKYPMYVIGLWVTSKAFRWERLGSAATPLADLALRAARIDVRPTDLRHGIVNAGPPGASVIRAALAHASIAGVRQAVDQQHIEAVLIVATWLAVNPRAAAAELDWDAMIEAWVPTPPSAMYVRDLAAKTPLMEAVAWRFLESLIQQDREVNSVNIHKAYVLVQVFPDQADKVVDRLTQDLPHIAAHGRHEPSLVGLLLKTVRLVHHDAFHEMHAAAVRYMDNVEGAFASRPGTLEASDLAGAAAVLARGLLPSMQRRMTARRIMACVSSYVSTHNVRQDLRDELFELSAAAMAVVCDLGRVEVSLGGRHLDGICCKSTAP
jgi:hypothetical protein